jgi:cell division protein FtsI/penicillin-binding protein 2
MLGRRLAPLAALAACAFAAGLVVGGSGEDPRRATAQDFADAWARSDYVAMRALLNPAARSRTSPERFGGAYREAARTLTLAGVTAGRAEKPRDGVVVVPVTLRTRIFGTISGRLALPVEEDGVAAGVAWGPQLVFPGLRKGEKLTRTTRMPPRGTIQARDGTAIARGAARESALGPAAAEIAGHLGPAPPERAGELERRGVPAGAQVGLNGLEREFDAQLAGTPGGVLRAGNRVVARTAPRRGSAVRTTIDPRVQDAAVEALAGRFGGIAVLRPDSGEVLGLAGVAYSAPQPPGSVFKIITLAGSLKAGVAKPTDSYPVQTAATLEGVELENANGESCGGSLRLSFAHSCNSVFAPMGAELGAKRLVATAEAFGFNEDPGIAGAARSTIPPADEIGDDLAVGSTAIGQGKVLATPLTMAGVAAAIGEHGVLSAPTLRKGDTTARSRATTRRAARIIGRYMRTVVTTGTGVAAAIPGVRVAGKTGTAELRDTTEPQPVTGQEPVSAESDTDAWFVAFAPARAPRVAVAVMLIGQGAGGATAAPAARVVLEAALKRRG